AGRQLVRHAVQVAWPSLFQPGHHGIGGVLLVQPGLQAMGTAVVGPQPLERGPVLAQVLHPGPIEPAQAQGAERQVAGADRGPQPLGDQRAQLGLASPKQDFQSFSNWAMSSMITVAPPTWTSTG